MLILALVQRDIRISKTRMLGNCLCIYFAKIGILKGELANDLKTMLKSIHQISAFKVFFIFKIKKHLRIFYAFFTDSPDRDLFENGHDLFLPPKFDFV